MAARRATAAQELDTAVAGSEAVNIADAQAAADAINIGSDDDMDAIDKVDQDISAKHQQVLREVDARKQFFQEGVAPVSRGHFS